MDILYCGDENIKDGLLISILSLLKNVPTQLHIYVFTIKYQTETKTYNVTHAGFAFAFKGKTFEHNFKRHSIFDRMFLKDWKYKKFPFVSLVIMKGNFLYEYLMIAFLQCP